MEDIYIDVEEREELNIAMFRDMARAVSNDMGLTADEFEREIEEFIGNTY